MIYTDEQLRDWWKILSKTRKREIFDTMIDRAWSDGARAFAESLMQQWDDGKELSPKQLAAIRRWDR